VLGEVNSPSKSKFANSSVVILLELGVLFSELVDNVCVINLTQLLPLVSTIYLTLKDENIMKNKKMKT
jgi:hypothetical protein